MTVKPLHVLVVDDSAVMREAMHAVLGHDGAMHGTAAAGDGDRSDLHPAPDLGLE